MEAALNADKEANEVEDDQGQRQLVIVQGQAMTHLSAHAPTPAQTLVQYHPATPFSTTCIHRPHHDIDDTMQHFQHIPRPSERPFPSSTFQKADSPTLETTASVFARRRARGHGSASKSADSVDDRTVRTVLQRCIHGQHGVGRGNVT